MFAHFKFVPCLLLALGLAASETNASIIVVAPTAGTNGSFQVTADITFTITATSPNPNWIFVLDDWVTSDGTDTFTNYSPNLSFSIDGAAPASYFAGLSDNINNTVNDLTPNDGYIFSILQAIPSATTVTLKAGSYVLLATPDFNPLTTQTFTGNMFVADGDGNRLSNIVMVPEPTTAVAFGLGLCGVLLRSRKRLGA